MKRIPINIPGIEIEFNSDHQKNGRQVISTYLRWTNSGHFSCAFRVQTARNTRHPFLHLFYFLSFFFRIFEFFLETILN